MDYVKAFIVGGILCLIGQILIDKTKLTPARILVSYVVIGVFLGAIGAYKPLVEFAGAGATVPLTGFGYTLAKGVKEAVDEKGISRFISPTGVETATIRSENEALKRELYEIVGLAIQSRSRDNNSAESKAWDFQNASQFLAARADLLEQSELEAWKIMHRYDRDIQVPQICYNRKFAIRDLESAIAGLLQLSTLDVGSSFRRAIGYAATELLDDVEPISTQHKQEIFNEINRKENV